jgi:hypothetical protein
VQTVVQTVFAVYTDHGGELGDVRDGDESVFASKALSMRGIYVGHHMERRQGGHVAHDPLPLLEEVVADV